MIQRLRERANHLKLWTYALYLAYRDPRVPWHARLFALAVVSYAFSPIDLIPDFLPVIGYLDDLVIVPLGLSLAIRMIPRPILEECKVRAEEMMVQGKPTNWVAAGVIVALWLLTLGLGITLAVRAFS